VFGVVVMDYVDHAEGTMEEDGKDGGRFTEVVLKPRITITADSDVAMADRLHHTAHEKCFIASSVNFPVRCEPVFVQA
jgi:organic hydroperoxide reductase OsmC/OhrA